MNAIVEQKSRTPTQVFRDELQKMDHELSTALPPHIPVERFMRVVLTAVNANGDLVAANRRSLFAAAMKAAQDGLLPDGRDGAFVVFKGLVQWMPMVGGILKKVRNSGDLLTIAAHVAYAKDKFSYRLGDEESIEHEPSLEEDRGDPVIVYAVARTKDGGIYREVMTVKDIEKVRAVSRAAKNGPWVDWWGEMAKKTVIRRLSKRLPMSSDLDDLIRRDDELYDFNKGDGEGQTQRLFRPVHDPLSDEAPAIEHDESENPTDAASQPLQPASVEQAGPESIASGPAEQNAAAVSSVSESSDTAGSGANDGTSAPESADIFPGDIPTPKKSAIRRGNIGAAAVDVGK